MMCVSVLWVSQLLGQNTGLSGKVAAPGRPNTLFAVNVINPTDSALLQSTLTDDSGNFELVVHDTLSHVYLAIVHAGFKPYQSKTITLQANDMTRVEPIMLLPQDQVQLKEVSISALAKFIEVKPDKTVVNPDALATTAGQSAYEVLQKSPGVLMKDENSLTLKGKNGVVVMVDGRKVYMSDADLMNYLKSIPSASVQQIEIMTNPSSKYDAEGNAGIINIKLKKSNLHGFNAIFSTSYGQGIYYRNNNSINLNYRVNRFNYFFTGSYVENNSFQDLTIHRKYFNSQNELNTTFRQNTLIKMHAANLNLKAGVDYYVSDKSVVGLSVQGFNNRHNNTVNNTAKVTDSQLQLTGITESYKPSKRNWNNQSVNANYTYKPDSSIKELSVSADYVNYQSVIRQRLITNNYTPDYVFINSSLLRSKLPSDITLKTAKADWTQMAFHEVKVETGLKGADVATDNVASFYDVTDEGEAVNNQFTNSFKFNESVYAAYVNASLERRRWSAQAGLRYEHTHYKGQQYGNAQVADSTFQSNYGKLFPTLYVSWFADTAARHQFNLSVGRRINRPNYQDMNPFTYPLDLFTLYSGNPFLKPTLSWNVELSHVWNNSFTTTLMFSEITDVISETIEQNTNTFFSRPGNIGKQYSYGISMNAVVSNYKMIQLMCYGELMWNQYKSVIYNQTMNNKGWYAYVGPTIQVKMNKGWMAELGGSYQTRIVSAQFVLSPAGTVNVAIVKKLKNNITLKLNATDIFYTNQPVGEIKNLYQSEAGWYSYLDTRVVTLSLSYRLTKGKVNQIRQIKSNETEQNRVK
jgi:hypothetical protein